MDHSIYGVFESIIFLVFSIEVIYFFNIEPHQVRYSFTSGTMGCKSTWLKSSKITVPGALAAIKIITRLTSAAHCSVLSLLLCTIRSHVKVASGPQSLSPQTAECRVFSSFLRER